MKWSTAVQKVEQVTAACQALGATPATIVPLRVREAWLVGGVLDAPGEELDVVRVALAVDALVPWGTQPQGAGQWLNASGLLKAPVALVWRRVGAVAGLGIVRPLRCWEETDGTDAAAVAAVRAGTAEALRAGALTSAEHADRLAEDLDASLAAVRRTSADVVAHRFSPGSPQRRADALADAVAGYLELLDARGVAGD